MTKLVWVLAALLGMGTAPALAGTCDKMLDAALKGSQIPHRINSEQVRDDHPGTWQTIDIGNKRYRGEPGAWTVATIDMDAENAGFKALIQAHDNDCTLEGSEAVAGEMADVVVFHFDQAGLKAQIKLWVSQATGLTLRMETNVTGDGQDKFVTATFDYKDIHAPPDAQ